MSGDRCVPRRHSCRRLASSTRTGVEMSLDTARTSACATSVTTQDASSHEAVVGLRDSNNPAEWIEWDLSGNLLSRTVIPSRVPGGPAYSADGRLYGRFRVKSNRHAELRVLERGLGTWVPVRANLPETAEGEGAFLLGAHGEELVIGLGIRDSFGRGRASGERVAAAPGLRQVHFRVPATASGKVTSPRAADAIGPAVVIDVR